MDPPVSHILANQIDTIEVIEGPYDIETFGTMSGGVKIKTKKPTQKTHGELNFGVGSWNYLKVGATASGGNDVIRVLISGSSESSDQYKDGDGNTMAQQIKVNSAKNPTDLGLKSAMYQPANEDMKAYTKRSVMAKAFVTVTDDQELRLSYTANRSDDVLYPNSKMDAIYDDSNIYSVEYDINNITDIYKKVNLQYYYSDVDHPMGTDYRMSSAGAKPIKTHQLQTTMEGLKLKNDLLIAKHKILIGLDASNRTWDGTYYSNFAPLPNNATKTTKSIDNALTKNVAIFAKLEKSMGALDVSIGARYDSTEISSDDISMKDQDYSALNANIFATYNLNSEHKIFLGYGQASRVPDARELYFKQNSPLPAPKGRIKVTGTDTLEQSKNSEIDFGYETDNENFKLKIKGFYSMLSDYIYYQKNLKNNNFVNLDATVYGAELSASYYATDDITIDMGASYKRGTKDDVAVGQDEDLANMSPLRGNIAINYEYANNSLITMDLQASDKWDDIDSVNGEQVLDSWSVLNLKVKHAINKNFDFTIGVNNLFDETYAKSNTYADLILVTSGAGDVMLLNEPGRYIYTNVDFRF
jgi:iron complex outermembrane receptor protein